MFSPLQSNAQDNNINANEDPETYNELLITVYLKDGYSFETDVLISDSNLMYLNVEGIFKTLKIKCLPNMNGLYGFIAAENNIYSIDFIKKKITIGDKSINIAKGVVEEFGIKYIASTLISEAFGLTFLFNPRSLSAKLTVNFELPFLKQMRIEKTRENISKLQGKTSVVDTIISRDYHFFKFGNVDWGLNSSQSINSASSNDNLNNASIRVGTELLFGEANFSTNYSDQSKFDIKQLQYNWRWINNDHKIIKQAQLGRVSSQNFSKLNAPIIGATINNSPNTIRKASGYFTINEITEPNWTVELYINDVLVDFTEADASGLYLFKVPIVFGYTTLRLKFYGPLGEERTEERTMNTPYTFAPVKTLAYSLTAGILQNTEKDYYSKVVLNYGFTRFFTLTGGLEYLSGNRNNTFIPFAKVTFQPLPKMVLNFEYVNEENLKGLLNFYVTENAFLEVNYIKSAVLESNETEQIRIRFSSPFKTNFFGGLARFELIQSRYASFNYNQVNFGFSGYFKQLKINSSSFINWASANTAQMNTVLALAYKLKKGLSLFTSVRYDLAANNLSNVSASLQMKISKMNLSASYQKSLLSKRNYLSISLTYNLPFSRMGISSSYSDGVFNFSENASGSLAFGGEDTYVKTGNNSAIGKGGLLLYPFLDLNQNGTFDKGEEVVLLSSVRVPGATAVISKKDSIIRVFDLNAFVNYTIEFSDASLDYVSWRFKQKTYQVLVDPNQFKRVFVPIIVIGEINGTVYLKKGKNMQGQGRITLQIFNDKGAKIAETLSEFDGYYSYLGLKPGKYTVRVDPAQLKALNYQASPAVIEIVIHASEDGDILDGLNFKLNKKNIELP
jgi:hypothetical protein